MTVPEFANLPTQQTERLKLTHVYDEQNRRQSDPFTEAILGILPHLSKTFHKYKDGKLALLLNENFLSYSADVVVAAVENMPQLASRIVFIDGKTKRVRKYEDVIWDVEKNPLRLARLAYQTAPYSGEAQIIITPEILGNNSPSRNVLDCRKVELADARISGLGLVTRLHAVSAFGEAAAWINPEKHQGKRQLIQTDRVVITGIDDMRAPNPVIFMNVAVANASFHDLPLPAKPHPISLDRSI